MHETFVFAGFGGQGVMFAGQLLAYAGMDAGQHVTWIPSYGPEMRGGTAHCYVVVSDSPIGSPIVKHPQVGIVFNNPSFEKYADVIAPGGALIVNDSLIEYHCQRDDITEVRIKATDLAYELGNARLTNMILLAAALTARPIIPAADLRAALEGHIPAHRRNLLPLNYAAVERGITAANTALRTAMA